MDKLKKQVFRTIFIILILFVFVILCIFNMLEYSSLYNSINDMLKRDDIEIKKDDNIEKNNIKKEEDNKDNHKIFMDTDFYTIVLNENNKIIDIINHTENGLSNTKLKKISKNIINNNKEDKYYIGNLYFNKYSYNYKVNKYIKIVDNSSKQTSLYNRLKVSILIFIICIFIIYFISNKLTKYVIKPAEDAFEKQKNFISDASHELKTPLSIIMASIEAMEDYPNDKKWITNIKEESIRMNKLITTFLDLAKLENNTSYDYKVENLSKIIKKSCVSLDALLYENNLKLDENIQDNIEFYCNSFQIKELMLILLDNAIKHSYKNSTIEVKLYKEKKNIIIQVINEGDPIKEEDREKIFDRFYRADKSRNSKSSRYGLGLSIAKTIAQNHKGSICCYSENNKTYFKIVF